MTAVNVVERLTDAELPLATSDDPQAHGAHAATDAPSDVTDPSDTARHAESTDEVPDDVVDRLLWRDAQHVLARHRPTEDRCTYCDGHWPCTAQRLAERAEVASRLPWRDGWTTRHDLNGMLALPEWRAAHQEARRPRPHQ